MSEQTFNIPQIIAVVLVGFLAVRWLLSSSSSQAGGSRGSGRQINPAHVEQIHQMFPQLDRRAIMWDLQRNGHSVQATTERVLGGRTLAQVRSVIGRPPCVEHRLTKTQPPPSFQPNIPNSAAPPVSSTSRSSEAKAQLPDLITRYNLSSKITTQNEPQEDQAEAATSSAAAKSSGWSQNKVERSELMKKRREEMVLAARRKMQEKDKKVTGTST